MMSGTGTKTTRRGLMLLVATSTAFGIGGCSCEEGSSPDLLSVRFVSPEQGATLGCAEDVDRDTPEVIDIAVDIVVDLAGAAPDSVVARLRVDGDTTAEAEGAVDAEGSVSFASFAVPVGEITLVAEVLEGEAVKTSSVRQVQIVYDAEDPDCIVPIEPTDMTFTGPQGPLSAADDADSFLGNGLQTDVTLQVTGPTEGQVRLDVVQLS